MFKKIPVLFFGFLLSFSVNAGGLEDYMVTINNQCPGINQLIIKKSLIEITQQQSCNSSFTILLLRDCPKINCPELINYWQAFNNSKSGTVIGK